MEAEATVYIVDDDAAVRQSLTQLSESVGLRVESYGTGQAFLDAYDLREDTGPTCIVVDVRMPGMSGLELQEKLNQRNVRAPLIVITGHGDVPIAVRALKAGALDFLEKPFSPQSLLDRITHALELDRDARRVRGEIEQAAARFDLLTPREREVTEMLVVGKSVKMVAGELGLSHKTVQVHRANIMKKTRVESLAELVRLAVNSKTFA